MGRPIPKVRLERIEKNRARRERNIVRSRGKRFDKTRQKLFRVENRIENRKIKMEREKQKDVERFENSPPVRRERILRNRARRRMRELRISTSEFVFAGSMWEVLCFIIVGSVGTVLVALAWSGITKSIGM